MTQVTAIGVDVGGTNIRAARIAADGSVLDWKAGPTAEAPDHVIAQIRDLLHSLNDGSAKAAGIGLPGRVNSGEGQVLSGGYVDLAGVRLADLLRDSFSGPVLIDNDGNMALVAEQAVGRARGIANVIMFTIGTGIGGAVFGNGAIFRGGGTAGQLGHLTVDVNGEPCLCGRRGCVETTSSGKALARHLDGAGLAPDTDVDVLLAMAESGDGRASRVLELWASPLRAAIDSAVAAFDPQLVLLGGGLGASAHRALALFPAMADWYQCPVEPAALGDRAGVIGAGLSALKSAVRKAMKRAVFVNGVPASGKSTVARAVSAAMNWPLLTLDTVKEAFFAHLGTGDRDYNRLLGKASYQAMFALIKDFPDKSVTVIDAWFGFQPVEVLQSHIAHAGLGRIAEIWCHAPASVVGARYEARLAARHAGHLGADYVQELIRLRTRQSRWGCSRAMMWTQRSRWTGPR